MFEIHNEKNIRQNRKTARQLISIARIVVPHYLAVQSKLTCWSLRAAHYYVICIHIYVCLWLHMFPTYLLIINFYIFFVFRFVLFYFRLVLFIYLFCWFLFWYHSSCPSLVWGSLNEWSVQFNSILASQTFLTSKSNVKNEIITRSSFWLLWWRFKK